MPQSSINGTETALPSTLTPQVLSQALALVATKMSFLSGLKTQYRPYICPLDQVLAAIPEGARVYDIGCGSGSLLFLAHQFRNAAVVHGYDVSAQAVEAAQVLNLDPQVFQVSLLDKANFVLPDLHGYDTVTLVDVLHHIPPHAQAEFIQIVFDRMQPGARLILKDIDAAKPLGALCNQLHDLIFAREWVHAQSLSTVRAMMTQAGFHVQQEQSLWTLWYPHFLLVGTVAN